MHFGFVLDSSDIDLKNIDLLDTHLDLLDIDIPNKHFVSLQYVLKTSSRRRQVNNLSSSKTSSRRFEDIFSVTIFRLPTFLQDLLQEVFKTPSRRLGRQKFVTLKTC